MSSPDEPLVDASVHLFFTSDRDLRGYLNEPFPAAATPIPTYPSGATGDATLAAAEKGERLLDHGARAFIELLADVDKFDVKRLLPGPRP